jgi:hypothetical protein
MRYETPEDLKRERAVMDRTCARWRCEAQKLGPDEIDFQLVRDGRVVAYAEVKTRHNARDAYPTYCVDRSKWRGLQEVTEETGLPAFLVVDFVDGLHYVRVADQPYRTGVMHRKDRGDPSDRDVVIHIPVADMVPV